MPKANLRLLRMGRAGARGQDGHGDPDGLAVLVSMRTKGLSGVVVRIRGVAEELSEEGLLEALEVDPRLSAGLWAAMRILHRHLHLVSFAHITLSQTLDEYSLFDTYLGGVSLSAHLFLFQKTKI